MQSMAKDAGIKLNIDNHPASEFSDIVTSHKFQILGLGWSASDPYGYSSSGTQIYGSTSESNFSFVGSEEIDQELAAVGQIEDTDEAISAFNAAEKKALALYAQVPYDNGPVITAVKQGLANYGPSGYQGLNPHWENIGWQTGATASPSAS